MFRLAMPVVGLLIALAVPAVVSRGQPVDPSTLTPEPPPGARMPCRGQRGDLRHPARRKRPHADGRRRSPVRHAVRDEERRAPGHPLVRLGRPAGGAARDPTAAWHVVAVTRHVGADRPDRRARELARPAGRSRRLRVELRDDSTARLSMSRRPGHGTILHHGRTRRPRRVLGSASTSSTMPRSRSCATP